MSGTTTNRSYPYPESTDAPNVPADMQSLAEAVDTDVQSLIPVYSVWTPTWSGLAKGTSPTEVGWYWQLGKLVVAQYFLAFGTGSPGFSAEALFTLPVAAHTGGNIDVCYGAWSARDVSASNYFGGTISGSGSSGAEARLIGAWTGTAPSRAVGSTSSLPFTPASTDKISLNLSYRAA